jgi:hypothetical protein
MKQAMATVVTPELEEGRAILKYLALWAAFLADGLARA